MQPKAAASITKSGGQVRVRGQKWPLPVQLDIEGRGKISVNIQPNKWTTVCPEIFEFLKSRFDGPRYTTVPDVEANEDHPHAPGSQPIMKQEEVESQFYIEFKS
jgi:hypothetical protein